MSILYGLIFASHVPINNSTQGQPGQDPLTLKSFLCVFT